MSSASPSPTSEKPEADQVLVGLVVLLVLLAGVIAGVIGIRRLGNPYYAIVNAFVYLGLVASLAVRLRRCLRLAKGSEYAPSLRAVTVWVVFSVLGVVVHLGDVLRSDNREYINRATAGGMYLALWSALGLIERLLKEIAPEPPAMEGFEGTRSPEGGA